MSTPDPQDASPSPEHSPGNSPEYSASPADSDMAADMDPGSKSDAALPSQKTANGQKSTSAAKDPLRPRRKKARRACLACQRAHLTCGDERPCQRCIKRNLDGTCTDGVRKKAKYLHDAPDSALMPGIGHYHHINGNAAVHFPAQGQDQGVGSQPGFYAQASSAPFYPGNQIQAHVPVSLQEVPAPNSFAHPQPPISPPYNQTNHGPIANAPTAPPQGPPTNMPQFGGPLFDPSDPALFNFDISSLNFGSHYGALELGMLGHISSGIAETPPGDNSMLNPLNQAASVYNPQIRPGHYGENNLPVASHGLPQTEWENAHSRQGSLQVQTPHNTPTTANMDHVNHRHDSINAPHAYVIGQGGPASISSASPGSTEMNSAYDNDNPLSSATFFANSAQARDHGRSPTVGRPQHPPNTALQPIQANAPQKRRKDTSWIYETINEPFPYVGSWHHLTTTISRRFCRASAEKIKIALSKFRPSLLHAAERLTTNDAILQERNLQRSLVDLEEKYSEVGVPYILCRRTGEVVAMNKEFTILTGWDRGVLLGKEANLNVNLGLLPLNDASTSEASSRTNTTPLLAGQESKKAPFPVNMIELLDERSAVEWAGDLSELIYLNNRAQRRRVNMLRYRTEEDVAKAEEYKANVLAHGGHIKHEPLIKLEGGPVHCAETSMMQLGARDGLVDCMLSLHVKRDTLGEPLLLCMHLMPVLEKRPHP